MHSSSSKISPKALYNNSENDGLKQVDISSKFVMLQCSCLRNLYDEKFHEQRLIPSHLNHMNFVHASVMIVNYILKFLSFTN